eukprot:TRINITY_DN5564_c0_g4_i1.p1 TRINITY_DN5564_c0_g4~~TRINITY_DN5564_c0_g4_i1.p1  ORF type:complete len:252 (+),score=64.93 TRINITY_DN5564_c0_g4_i1:1-756(+)
MCIRDRYQRRVREKQKHNVFQKNPNAFPDERSPTPSGFSLDRLCTPNEEFEFIGTPHEISQCLTSKKMKEDIILVTVLSTVCLICGDERLIEDYEEYKQQMLSVGSPELLSFLSLREAEPPFHEELSLHMILGDIKSFEPDLSKQREKVFGIKQELYRPLQQMIRSLSIFFNTQGGKSTMDQIELLVKKGIFTPQGGANLKKALSKVLALRIRAHLFYNQELEFLFHVDIYSHLDKNKHLYLEQKKQMQIG